MFAPFEQQKEEDYFASIQHSKNIECIMPSSELLISFRVNGLKAKKPCFVYAEKMDFKGLIQLRVAERDDQRRMYITTVESSSFHELKHEQSLHVTFAGFIDNLVRILQDCQAGKLEMHLVQQVMQQTHAFGSVVQDATHASTASTQYQLQFVEMRAFKNLVHLSLPCRMAPLNVVLFYMNSILDALQKKASAQENATQQLQHELQNQARRNEQLTVETVKLRENMLENTKALTQRHSEEMQQMQESLRMASEQRHNDNERSRKSITALQLQVEKLVQEKEHLYAEKSQELKRSETLKQELATTKSNNANLKEQNEKLQGELSSHKNLERKNEMHLNDARKHIHDLQEKLKQYDKTKDDIVAELEAEKKISQTKRKALEMATEEISKANEIILKQTHDLVKQRKTIAWRTEVALQQEKAINEREKSLQLRDEEIKHMQQIIENLHVEIPRQLESMRKFANTLELKYSEQIRVLKEKLQPTTGKENYAPNISTSTSNRRK